MQHRLVLCVHCFCWCASYCCCCRCMLRLLLLCAGAPLTQVAAPSTPSITSFCSVEAAARVRPTVSSMTCGAAAAAGVGCRTVFGQRGRMPWPWQYCNTPCRGDARRQRVRNPGQLQLHPARRRPYFICLASPVRILWLPKLNASGSYQYISVALAMPAAVPAAARAAAASAARRTVAAAPESPLRLSLQMTTAELLRFASAAAVADSCCSLPVCCCHLVQWTGTYLCIDVVVGAEHCQARALGGAVDLQVHICPCYTSCCCLGQTLAVHQALLAPFSAGESASWPGWPAV
jgi:hypothetical protein